MNNTDSYYLCSEVSNSDLTALKELLHPRESFGDREAAFRLGSVVDAMVTEPRRVDFLGRRIDGEAVADEDFELGRAMQRALRAESRRDAFLAKVLQCSHTQKCMFRHGQEFDNGGFIFTLDTRCKWDWWLEAAHFGGDLKTTSASSQREFEEAVDYFDWDRSRAWYMDIAGSSRDFIYAISKKNFQIFKLFIEKDSELYRRGREKYLDLAFKYWAFTL